MTDINSEPDEQWPVADNRIRLTVEPWYGDPNEWMWMVSTGETYINVVESGRALTKEEGIRKVREAGRRERERRNELKREAAYREANRFQEYV